MRERAVGVVGCFGCSVGGVGMCLQLIFVSQPMRGHTLSLILPAFQPAKSVKTSSERSHFRAAAAEAQQQQQQQHQEQHTQQ